MPELPDVQVWKSYLDATALHQVVARVRVPQRKVLGDVTPGSLGRRLAGRRLDATKRHGKYLFVRIEGNGWLVLHFGMTGSLVYSRVRPAPDRTAVLFRFRNGSSLAYVSYRLLGRVDWTPDENGFVRKRGLGPDALAKALTVTRFRDLIGSRRSTIKSALMNQRTIAGIGNVYADEILFQAGIHPKRRACDLDEATLDDLSRRMRSVLTRAVEARASPSRMPSSFLLPRRGRPNARCPRCGIRLRKTRVSGRTSWFCPGHQR